MGIAAVRGFQGDGTFADKKHVMATSKHFAAHGQPESGANCGPGNFSERVLRDVFLFPFREVIQQATPASVMPSYNEIDGVPSHANAWLLHDVLRKEWGFRGFLVSDYYAITELMGKEISVSHAVAKDKTEAALRALKAGVNMELPDPDCYPLLPSLVEEGAISERMIDELVAPLLEYKFRLGLFEDPYVSTDGALTRRAHPEGASPRPARRRGNDRPVEEQGGRAPAADGKIPRPLPSLVPMPIAGSWAATAASPGTTPPCCREFKSASGDDATILYSEGCKITVGGAWDEDIVTLPDPEEDRQSIARAVSTARQADVVVLVVGDNEQTSREAWSYRHLGDRTSLDLFGAQNALVEAVAATGKPMVLVLFNGRPNSLNVVRMARWPRFSNAGTWGRKRDAPLPKSSSVITTLQANFPYQFPGRRATSLASITTNRPPAGDTFLTTSHRSIRSASA